MMAIRNARNSMVVIADAIAKASRNSRLDARPLEAVS
jgi:hypothetical protein